MLILVHIRSAIICPHAARWFPSQNSTLIKIKYINFKLLNFEYEHFIPCTRVFVKAGKSDYICISKFMAYWMLGYIGQFVRVSFAKWM